MWRVVVSRCSCCVDLTEGRVREKGPHRQADGENEKSDPNAMVFLEITEHLAGEQCAWNFVAVEFIVACQRWFVLSLLSQTLASPPPVC